MITDSSLHPLLERIGVGTRLLGGPAIVDGVPVGGAEASESHALTTLHRAWDLGVRRYDTCDAYGLGRAERLIGRFRADLGREADDLRLSARLGMFRGTASHPLRAVHMRHQLEQLAENTGVEELDLVSLSDVSAGPGDGAEAVDAMLSFRETGWARRIGIPLPELSGWGAATAGYSSFLELVERLRPDVVHVGIADLFPLTVLGDETLFEFAQRIGTEILVHGPLVHGLLAGTYPAAVGTAFGEGDIRSGLA
ncbi:aldo/keto reductase [Kitasatospora sp. NPDC058201]|uniref:aldo/keto reductase n=1 Tax=unclassified Kitasatospora TaxID=2633591 RepID=UPI00365F4FD0